MAHKNDSKKAAATAGDRQILEPLIFERSVPGRIGYRREPHDVPEKPLDAVLPGLA